MDQRERILFVIGNQNGTSAAFQKTFPDLPRRFRYVDGEIFVLNRDWLRDEDIATYAAQHTREETMNDNNWSEQYWKVATINWRTKGNQKSNGKLWICYSGIKYTINNYTEFYVDRDTYEIIPIDVKRYYLNDHGFGHY